MGVLILPATVMAAAVGAIIWQSRKAGGPMLSVLRLMPVALLFLSVPIVSATLQMIGGFQEMAQSGRGGAQAAAVLCRSAIYRLWLGSVAFLLALVTSALLHMLSTGFDDDRAWRSDDARPAAGLTGRIWIVIATSLLVVPAGLQMYMAVSTVSTVMTIAAARTPLANLADLSQSISIRLMVGSFGGVLLCGVLVLAGAFNVGLGRPRAVARSLAAYSWVILATAGTAGAWNAFRLTADLRRIEGLIK